MCENKIEYNMLVKKLKEIKEYKNMIIVTNLNIGVVYLFSYQQQQQKVVDFFDEYARTTITLCGIFIVLKIDDDNNNKFLCVMKITTTTKIINCVMNTDNNTTCLICDKINNTKLLIL